MRDLFELYGIYARELGLKLLKLSGNTSIMVRTPVWWALKELEKHADDRRAIWAAYKLGTMFPSPRGMLTVDAKQWQQLKRELKEDERL